MIIVYPCGIVLDAFAERGIPEYIYIYYERKKGRNYISRQACFVNRFTLQGFNIYSALLQRIEHCSTRKSICRLPLYTYIYIYIYIYAKAFIPADKTTNLYELDKTQHEKLIQNSITTTFKKGSKNIMHSINQEAKAIATLLDIQDRTERLAERQAFISLKDY